MANASPNPQEANVASAAGHANQVGNPLPPPRPAAAGTCLFRLSLLLLGSAFLALLVFAAFTLIVKGNGRDHQEQTDSGSVVREEIVSSTNDAEREALPKHQDAPATDHLVPETEVERVLGGSFAPPPPPLPEVPALSSPSRHDPSPPSLPVPPPKGEPVKPAVEPLPPPVTPKPPVVVNNPPPAKPEPVKVDVAVEKRLETTEDEAREQLLAVPELRLFSDLEIETFRDQEKSAESAPQIRRKGQVPFPVEYAFNARLNQVMFQAGVKQGLPLQPRARAQMAPATATVVQTLSKNLRDLGFVSIPATPTRVIFPGRVGPNQATIENATAKEKTEAFKEWCDVNKVEKFNGALATLLQMLQVENVPTRLVLVRELAKVKSPAATAVLAGRALADLSPEVRDAAVAELSKRPAGQYTKILLQGLRYPYPPIADRAALALRKLKSDGAVPKLVDLLDQPDPSVPFLDKRSKKFMVRELVRLNHMRNCLLCHAPSANDKDGLVRGLVPTPGQPLPRLYYSGQRGNFVRADVTFLRQDFSVNLFVKAAAPWPNEQRFDFITRLRPPRPEEMPKIAIKPQDLLKIGVKPQDLLKIGVKPEDFLKIGVKPEDLPKIGANSAELPKITAKSAELPKIVAKLEELAKIGVKADDLAKITARSSHVDYPQREAVRYALTGLTGKDGGNDSDQWRQLLGIAAAPPEKKPDGAVDKAATAPKDK